MNFRLFHVLFVFREANNFFFLPDISTLVNPPEDNIS